MTTISPKQNPPTALDRIALRAYYAANLAGILALAALSPPGKAVIQQTVETVKEITENAKRGYNAFENYVVAQALQQR